MWNIYFALINEKYNVFYNKLKLYFDQAFSKRKVKKISNKRNWIVPKLKEEKISNNI